MNKHIKRAGITTLTALALFGAVTGIAFASGYIQWRGTGDYNQTIENLELIGQRAQNLNQSNKQLQNVILDKDNKIDSLEQEIEALEKRIEGGQTSQDQLGQAEKDMKHVNQKTQEILNQIGE